MKARILGRRDPLSVVLGVLVVCFAALPFAILI